MAYDNLKSFYGTGNSPSYTSSDNNPATGTMTANLVGNPQAGGTGAPVNQVTILPGLDGTFLGNPVTHLFLVAILAMFVYYLLHSKVKGIEKEVATPRVGLASFFSIGVQAMVFIVLAKIVTTRYRIPGLTEMVGTA